MRPPQVGRCPTCYWGRAEDNYSAIRRQLLSHKKETMLSATTGMQRENIILSEATQRKTSITQFHLYVESKIEHKWPYLWNRQNHIQNRLVVAEGRGGWIGSLGLAEASYYIFNAKIWSYYIAQGTIYMAQQPTLVFLLGESMDREAWQANSPQGGKESDMTEMTEQAHIYILQRRSSGKSHQNVNSDNGHAQSLQSCLTLCIPMDCSPPGSSVHGIL